MYSEMQGLDKTQKVTAEKDKHNQILQEPWNIRGFYTTYIQKVSSKIFMPRT